MHAGVLAPLLPPPQRRPLCGCCGRSTTRTSDSRPCPLKSVRWVRLLARECRCRCVENPLLRASRFAPSATPPRDGRVGRAAAHWGRAQHPHVAAAGRRRGRGARRRREWWSGGGVAGDQEGCVGLRRAARGSGTARVRKTQFCPCCRSTLYLLALHQHITFGIPQFCVSASPQDRGCGHVPNALRVVRSHNFSIELGTRD
jgi:hypothetical protein